MATQMVTTSWELRTMRCRPEVAGTCEPAQARGTLRPIPWMLSTDHWCPPVGYGQWSGGRVDSSEIVSGFASPPVTRLSYDSATPHSSWGLASRAGHGRDAPSRVLVSRPVCRQAAACRSGGRCGARLASPSRFVIRGRDSLASVARRGGTDHGGREGHGARTRDPRAGDRICNLARSPRSARRESRTLAPHEPAPRALA